MQHKVWCERGNVLRLAILGLALGGVSAAALAQQPSPSFLPPVMVYADGQHATIIGVVVARVGREMKVREGDRALYNVKVTDATRIYSPSGPFKTDKTRHDLTSLMPGLRLTINGRGGSDGRFIAEKIKVSGTSLRTGAP